MVVAVPGGRVDGEVVERLLARQVLLGQRRPLVGQVLLGGEQCDMTVKVVVAQCLSGLGSGETAADNDECRRLCPVGSAYSWRHQLLEFSRIAHRVPAQVVVEVDEYVATLAVPLQNTVRPPPQIVVGIGARV